MKYKFLSNFNWFKNFIFVILLFLTVLTACVGKKLFEPGQTVAAKWIDGKYYLATILQRNKTEYKIKYADGTDGIVTENELLSISSEPNIIVGDSVMAVWSHARFYDGVIIEIRTNEAIIKWNDGSEPSLVSFGKIIKKN